MTLIVIKVLGRTDSSVTITAYMSLMMAPLSLPFAVSVWQWPTIEQLAWLVLIGILGGCAQIFLVAALKRAHAKDIMPLDFLKLIWASVIGFFVFHEMPDALTWVGGVMIVASSVLSTTRDDAPKEDRGSPESPL